MKKPFVGITMGDPAGIGPEIICKIHKVRALFNFCRPIIIGNVPTLEKALNLLNYKAIIKVLNNVSDFEKGKVNIIEVPTLDPLDFINKSLELIELKKIDLIATCPINKKAIAKFTKNFSGHTDYLAKRTKTKNYAMMFNLFNKNFFFVTSHVPLKAVPKLISTAKVFKTIKLADKTLKEYFHINTPKIAVLGFNPHAGSDDIFGNEEKTIRLAVNKAKHFRINCTGPFPADSFFACPVSGAKNLKKFDAVICMYHDQGLIPVKLLGFENAVNITCGLPFIRTSPSHGVAYDIAGKGVANPKSLYNACKVGVDIYNGKKLHRDSRSQRA